MRASEAQGLLVDPPVYVASGLPFRGLGMSCLPLRPFLSLLSLFWPARTRIDSSWRLTGTPAPCVTPSSLALHDDRYRLARLNSRDIAEGHRVQHGRAIEDQLHALWRGGARESAGMGVPRPPLADEGRARPNARTSTGASAPISSRSHSSLILALTNSTVSPTANCGHMSGGRGGMVR